jgi:hypothetical protein
VPDVRGIIVFVLVLLLGGGLWAALVSGCVAS